MLPSDAPTPPCAATVWERVGNTFDSTATFEARLGKLQRAAQPRAARADDHGVELLVTSAIGLFLHRISIAQPAHTASTRITDTSSASRRPVGLM